MKGLGKDAQFSMLIAIRSELSYANSCAVERRLKSIQNLQKSPLAREREPKIPDPLEPLARSRTFPDNPSESQASPLP